MQNEEERNLILQQLKNFESEGQDPDRDKEEEEPPPEDSIPDLPENQKAREFLKHAPSKGILY